MLMAEILHHLVWARPCKQWDIPPPSISNLCVFFFFEDVFDIRFEMCQALGSVPFFGPHGLGGVGDDHFFCE